MRIQKMIDSFYKVCERNMALISLFISVIALGISLFNTYNSVGSATLVNSSGQKIEKPEKLVKELPDDAPFMGNENAKLTIVEFADFQCPYCAKFRENTFPIIKAKYIDTGKAKFVYIDNAFLGQASLDAAEAAKCASEQGKFWQYHDELYKSHTAENRGTFDKNNLKKFAKNIGLDAESFESCIDDTRFDKKIQDELALGKKFGVEVTPSLIFGEKVIKGTPPISVLEEAIESQLK